MIDPISTSHLYAVRHLYTGESWVGETFRSFDAGDSWTLIEELQGVSVNSLAIAPTAPSTIYAFATDGTLFRSWEWGDSWSITGQQVDGFVPIFGMPDGGRIVVDPTDPSTLYATTWHAGADRKKAIGPAEKREAVGFLIAEGISMRRSCRLLRLSRSAWYRPRVDRREQDTPVMEVLNELIENRPRRGFWKCFKLLRRQGHGWNHKRVHRIYCQMGLNQKRRGKPRVPKRNPERLLVPEWPNQVWSAD